MTEPDWREYEEYLLSGLWHVHTDVTDGANGIDELLSFAADQNFPLIGFTEHVRESPTYDFGAFYESVTERAAAYELECVVGCEAKVLNTAGELDVSAEIADRADLVYAAYHGTPFEKDAYVESVHSMLQNPIVDVWAHPFAYAARAEFTLSQDAIDEILERAAAEDVLVEHSLRHESVLPADRIECIDIVGYDLHSIDRWCEPEPDDCRSLEGAVR
ncbi:PHP domain-containing protein [Natronorubrum sp. JWXQ-INN-674]|uniref:PHP domain-containing protein n=1 Tax=Natronorubrum halalkaliphilum TaxID=2691917 RepID=A0A6B0VPX7_9EURY|nr:PHP domain-containing protein [Natronorubrum halalkaliphilum]MXV63355.1 PHP domain-containing protein [Natronorubrum halalkaliphilum]